jgi:UDP-2,4-diacetamido-2,4,6-trideoxy-beta-L-altropyranose hydrolase
MGLGHVVRSLALADMLNEQFECHFIIRDPLPTLSQQILEVCESIITLPSVADDIEEANQITHSYLSGEEIVVLDGYHFEPNYQRAIKSSGCKLVCIDDIHAYHFVADVIVNHAGGVTQGDYSIEDYTTLKLGLQYALLRKEFREAALRLHRSQFEKGKVFVCLGGADPNNDLLSVLDLCQSCSFIQQVAVVIGAAYNHRSALSQYLNSTRLKVELLTNLSAVQMVAVMRSCEAAITPPSSIAYEWLSVGGSLFLKTIADNQKEMYAYFIDNNYALPLSNLVLPDRTRLDDDSIIKSPFDGKQKERLEKVFLNL